MDDIVTLLRKYQPYSKLHGQAADEIERLRAENADLRSRVMRDSAMERLNQIVLDLKDEASK